MNKQAGNTTNSVLIIILVIIVGFVVWYVMDQRGREEDRNGTGIEIEIGDQNEGSSSAQ